MKTISIVNLKGGVGKTVTAVNMAAILAEDYGKKVLVIDADPQANATRFYGISEDANTIACIMDGLADDPYDCIYCTAHEGVDIVPSDISLITADIASVSKGVGAGRLRDFLNVIDEDARTSGEATAYDVVLIDCMPSLGMITINALAAADSVIIPVQAHYLPAKGMTQLMKTIGKVKRQINPALKVDGVLLTLVDGRTNLARQTTDTLRQSYRNVMKIYRSEIPVAIKAAEISAAGKSIYAYDKGSKVAQAYADFSKEVLADGEKQRAKLQSSLSR